MTDTFNSATISNSTTPFQNSTEWVVVTGAPSSGKSSVLKYLSELGYDTRTEVARDYFENNAATNPNVRSDEASFQQNVTQQKLKLEKSLPLNSQIFLDRGIPDSISYYRVSGLNPNEAVYDCQHFRYKKVFLFERLPIHNDGVRIEDDATSDFIQKWLGLDYKALGYEIISVPVMSIKDRAEYIIHNLLGG